MFWIGTAAVTVALAVVLAWFLESWPPHEDETLALFVGRSSFGDLLHTVVVERGGAPLHFVFAWGVVQLGGGLTALRVVSLLFAVGSVPLIALLGQRLAGRAVGVVAALLASGTWVLIFHGIYGRMYSLFLFTSLLSFLALLRALQEPGEPPGSPETPSPGPLKRTGGFAAGGRRRFGLWGVALVVLLASHPYAVLVVGAQVLYVLLRRRRLREALTTLAAVAVVGVPFWWADVVLRDRFDVGVGGGGEKLGSPGAVLHYLWWVSGDFGAGHRAWSVPVLLLALAGALLLARHRRDSVLLTACVIAVPALAFTVATLGAATSPEARHLIFALPFFSVLLAVPLVELGRLRPPLTAALAAAAIATIMVGELRWAHDKTPPLFDGDPATRVEARAATAAWLASTARPDDVLLGYEPVYLRAWEQNRSFSAHAIPRADPALFAAALKDVPEPLGRGVWVFDAGDTTNIWERQTISFALPKPESMFEGHVYGPYLVLRSRGRLVTHARFLAVSEAVMRLGVELRISDADVNLRTMRQAESRF
jgi:4-amino-4-deoxy-L-arabinose transferase-like glycosyltransferase